MQLQFMAGDVRTNKQPPLLPMITIYTVYHSEMTWGYRKHANVLRFETLNSSFALERMACAMLEGSSLALILTADARL